MKAIGELSGPKWEKGKKESNLEIPEHLLDARQVIVLYIIS